MIMLKLFKKKWCGYNCDREGSAAVEFALIAPVFFAFVFGLLEAGFLMIRIALADNAVDQTGRQIYTGAAVSDGVVAQETLKQDIWDRISLFRDCMNNITLEAITITSFDDIPDNDATCRDDTNTTFKPSVTFDPGGASEIVFVRVCLTADVMTPFLGFGLSLPLNDNGRHEVVSSIAFVNEMF